MTDIAIYADDQPTGLFERTVFHAIPVAEAFSNRNPNARVEIRSIMGVVRRYLAGQEVTDFVTADDVPENAADVLTDAIDADPNTITADDINDLYARLDAALNSRPFADVLRLVRDE